jgi:hypothetical protein
MNALPELPYPVLAVFFALFFRPEFIQHSHDVQDQRRAGGGYGAYRTRGFRSALVNFDYPEE